MVQKLDESFGFYENALSLLSQRQQVLASNVANADTPNYKARDMNFAQALQAAQSTAAPPGIVQMATTHANHLSAAYSSLPGQSANFVKLRKPTQNNLDGNTVDMDVERNAFAENALQYETAVSLVSGSFNNLKTILQQG